MAGIPPLKTLIRAQINKLVGNATRRRRRKMIEAAKAERENETQG